MKKRFTRILAAFALLVFMMPSMAGWGQMRETEGFNLSGGGTVPVAANANPATGTINGTASVWNVTINGSLTSSSFQGTTGNRYWQMGKSSSSITSAVFSTSDISGTITSIVVNCASAGGSGGSLSATVGGNAFGTQNQAMPAWSNNNGGNVTFNGSASGAIVITEVPVSSKACYIQSITVTYTSGYTVTFDCDGGEGCPDNMNVQPGENNFTVPSNSPTMFCYGFDNYSDGYGNTYVPGVTYTIESDLDLTASWMPIDYVVYYYANNGTDDELYAGNELCGSEYEVAETAEDLDFEGPTETPYFVGWNTQADGSGTAYEGGDIIMMLADLYLYAQWSASPSFTVTYNCNGGTSGCPESQFVTGGTQIQLPAAPVKEGYAFNGWMCDGDLEIYAAGADYTVTENVEFEAQWMEKLDTPTISVAGVGNGTANTYYVTAQVTINQTDGAYIYYTTDGSTPTTNSIEYVNPFNVTSNCTIKAIAIFESYANSDIAEQEIIIVQPNEATFTDGIYTEPFDSQASFDKWIAYSVSGDETWVYNSSYGAYITGSSHDNEDWLISPKMAVENGKLHLAFDCVGRFGNQQTITALYSTDYPGYGNPNSYNWMPVTTKPAIPYNASNWTFKTIECDVNAATDVYFAFKYTSTTSSSGTFEMKPFTAKQYYPVNYLVNGGSGSMERDYYAVGETVYVAYPYFYSDDIEDGFIAPEGMAFSTWNTQADGQGTTYNPFEGDSFVMGASAVDLYAQWATAYQLTLDESENIEFLASCGSESLLEGESTNVVAGMRVELFEQEVAQGYEFGNFIVTKVNGGTVEVTYVYDEELQFGIYYFIMPAEDVIVTATTTKITTVVDELTREFIGNTNQSYSDWSGKKSESTAVYAGNTSGGGSDKTYIQLKSNDSNSGIVTTASGGKVKKVSVTWNSSTTSGRTLDVYGKNTPYSAATDLYATSGNTGQGTLLGSIVKGTSTELTVDGDYTYIGLRSKSGAMYIDKIEITWDNTYSATSNIVAHTENEGWYFIASPFSANNSLVATDGDNLPVAMDDDATDLFYYDEPTHTWKNYKLHPDDFTFANGVGYLYANSQNVTLTFAGTSVVTGNTKSIELSYHETTSDNEPNRLAGWNLVGNPFDCDATLDMDCYTISGLAINTQAHTAGTYTVAPCTGVMVQATEEGQTVTFTKATQGQAPQPSQLQMTVAQQVNSRGTTTSIVNDNAIVNFNEGSQLEKFAFNIDAAKLYIPQNDKEYAIVSTEAQGEMPVNFKAAENGTYTLTVNLEGVDMNYLHLIDNMTGMDVDLLQTSSYTFNATTRDYESRFRLVFAANNNNEDGPSTGSGTFAFYSNGNWIINNAGEATLQVVDLTGRILSSEIVNGSVSKTINAVPGVYMLRLINGENVNVQKIVVR